MRRRGAHARNALHWPRQWHNPLRWWTVVKICCNWSSPETQLADVTNFVIRLTVALVWVYSMHRSWNLIDAVGLCLHENSARRSAVGKVWSRQKSLLGFGLREEWRIFNRSLFDTFFHWWWAYPLRHWRLMTIFCKLLIARLNFSRTEARHNEWKCNDLKCVRKPTWEPRLILTHHANKSSRWAE